MSQRTHSMFVLSEKIILSWHFCCFKILLCDALLQFTKQCRQTLTQRITKLQPLTLSTGTESATAKNFTTKQKKGSHML